MEATNNTSAQAAENAEFASETLRGDIRDSLLTLVQSMETPWSKLSERDQQWRIESIDKLATKIIRKSTEVIAHHGFPHLDVGLSAKGKFGGGSLEMTIEAAFTTDNATKLSEYGSGRAILVLAEAGEFFGERRAAKPEPNQRAMDLDGASGDGIPEMDLAARNAAMIRNAISLAGITIDLSQFPPDERAGLADKIVSAGGRWFESEVAQDAEAEAPAPEKTTRARRRTIRETEAA